LFINYLVEEYRDDIETDLGIYILPNELSELFTENIYEPLSNYLTLLYFCFLNTSHLIKYKYIDNKLLIDKKNFHIKIRHKLKQIYDICNPDDIIELKKYITIPKNIENIKKYRISHINKHIMKYILENKIDDYYYKKINKNMNKLWGNLKDEDIIILKIHLKKNIYNDPSLHDIDVQDILNYIINADLKFLNGEDDPIIDDGTLFEVTNRNILLELRYIKNKANKLKSGDTYIFNDSLDNYIKTNNKYDISQKVHRYDNGEKEMESESENENESEGEL
jgi:hypothetical protein